MQQINEPMRRLPVGIQNFSVLREEGYLYVDKTDLVWNIANRGYAYNYLSRPRRFGKSLLVDTFQCYFEGRKELFEGLKIMDLENEWTVRPVIRFDMSKSGETLDGLQSCLDSVFCESESKYEIEGAEDRPFQRRFHDIIAAAYRVSGRRVAILVDEYDYPLLHSWGTEEHEKCAAAYRDVFAILKADGAMIHFVFITGVAKFTQISLFSSLNNIVNLSFDPQYECLCGISEPEMLNNFAPEVEAMADENGWTKDETLARLKENYDGYHFSRKCIADIYNPFNLVYAFSQKDINDYWAASGATALLPKFIGGMELKLQNFDNCSVDRRVLETSDITISRPELFLYQSGYLTIKSYGDGVYTLGFPNGEVRRTLYGFVLPALLENSDIRTTTTQNQLLRYLKKGNVSEAMPLLKALVADVPYSNKKLASMDMEECYRLIISTILNAIGLNVEVEHMLATGRIDMVATSLKFIYVIELKLKKNGGLDAAARQIVTNRYLAPFLHSDRKVLGLAIELDDLGGGITGWREVEE